MANQLGALAYTKDGEVFVPREVGPLHRPSGRAVVAHEVTHAAQQRRTGSNLPREDTAAGAALESQAQAAERYFRGDPGAPRPGPDQRSSHETVEAQQLMQRLVSEGFAVSGGAGAGPADPPLPPATPATPGVQRQTAPAPQRDHQAPSGPVVDWNPIASFGHAVASDLQAFGEDVIGSEWGLSHDVRDEMTRAANTTEREFAQNQYRQLRLQHRKTRFLAEHHQSALSPVDEHHIEELVDADVSARLAALQDRVEHRLLNERDVNGQSLHVINRDEFRALVARLFGDTSTDTIPPDDTGSAATSADGRPSRGSGSGGHTPAMGHTPARHDATGAAAIGAAAVADGANRPGTTTGRDPDQPDGSSTNASSATSRATGSDPSGATAPTGSAHRELTVGEGFRHLVADVVADAAWLDVGEWGMHLGEEEWRQFRRDLRDPLAPAPTPKGQQAAGGAHTGPGIASALPPANGRAETAAPSALGSARTEAATGTESTGGAATHHPSAAGTYPIGPGQAGQATAGPTGHEHLDLDHLDLDELSDRLYMRLRRRLRTELLVDRERAGLLTDFR
jgi:hypothetical protein